MSDETSSSSTSSEDESSEDGTSSEESENEVETAKGSYLHTPWLLQSREENVVTEPNSLSQQNNQQSSSESSSGSASDSNDNEENPKEEQPSRKAPVNKATKNKEMPDWEVNPEVYGLRRSSRQRKEPTRLNLKEADSSDDGHKCTRKVKHRKNSDATATLTDSSEEDSSEFESSSTHKIRNKSSGHVSKLNQFRAKVLGRKIKKRKATQRNARGVMKTTKGRTHKSSNTTLSDEYSSEDNQPVRASSRIQRNNKISYKESDSTQETDSDEVVEATEAWNGAEDDGSEAIEKIMDSRIGRLGATGSITTAYACAEKGDPNEDFDPQEEGEKQYLIKWKDWSHPHNTWESEATLLAQSVRGMKRLENFVKRQDEIDLWLRAASPEDREYYYCQHEMNRNVLAIYCKVERIIARSAKRNSSNMWEYQVKWCGLPYSECTWEEENLLTDFKDEIDAFEMRQENPCVPKRDYKILRQKPKFVPMTRQPEWLKGMKLRDYQLMGVNWLSHSWSKGNSVILADEMGLGKTIQSITFLSYLYHTHEIFGLFLIIVPLSTMTAWQTEFKSWAPYMNVIVYMGDQNSRATIRDVEWMFPNKNYKFNAVLTSYEILLKDKAFLGSHSWVVIIVDEAHRLKNDDSLLYRSLKEFKSDHRLLITGTPLQNSLKELWALLHFIMPEKFESWPEFEDEHAQNRDSGYASLHKVLQPYLLRRMKRDVEKSLPSKVEQILRVPMSSLQKQYYKWILTKNYSALSRGTRAGLSSFCNIIMELKKCCNHAHLVKPPEQEVVSNDVILQNVLRNSGKMVLLDKLLLRLKENGHRVLIFSQMVRMLDIIQDYLVLRRLQFQRLDGSVGSDKRRRALDHFNAPNSEDFCFLLSTRAGGLGINLATADTVIIFDSDWNPMNDLQAQARAHRIGQKNQVNIYRLVCAGSVEEDIIEKAKKKMVLDHLVIQRMDTSGKTVLFKNTAPSSTTNNPFNKEELSAILKFGAEELFQEAEGDEKEPECDIDEILRRAETRQEQPESSEADSLLSAFKVATFNLDEEEETGKDWEEIIPEKDRQKFAEEIRQKQEAELYLPRRARKKAKINAGSESENSDSNTSDDDDDGVDDVTGGSKKKGRPPRSGLREGSDYVRGFTTAEVRRFVKSYRKFGDPLSRLDAIARDAELSEQSEADLQRLGQQLNDKLHEMISNKAAENQEAKDEPTKHGRGRGPSFRIAGVSVSVKTTMACIEDLQPLVDVIPKDFNERKSFILSIPVRPMYIWDCTWGTEDDSKLLVGIYEFGMGSWEQIQSDPSLKLDKKILRPNGEKPQAKQLQSRAEYLIKLLKKALEQNHPGIHQHGSATHSRKRVVRDTTNATSSDVKGKRKTRKIKSKPRIEGTNSDIDFENGPSSVTTAEQHHVDNTNNIDQSIHDGKSLEKKKKGGRKRKATDDGSLAHGASEANFGGKKRKKQNKDTSGKHSSAKSKGPVHITLESNPVPIGTEEASIELDDDTFGDCKERLRPVKRALRELDNLPKSPEDCKAQAKRELTRRCILQIGDRVVECLRELHDPEEIKTMRRNLWIFVSKFTVFNADKLLRMYKSAWKRRESERKNKHEKTHKPNSDAVVASKSTVESSKQEQSLNNTQSKTRKIQHRHHLEKKKLPNTSPLGGGNESKNTSSTPTSPNHDKVKRTDASATVDLKPADRNMQRFRKKSPPSKHYEDRFLPHSKASEDRDPWRRSDGRSPPSDYRVRDGYVKGGRPPFNDLRGPPPGMHPDDPRHYREDEFRERERHMREYGRSPPRRRPERYWRGPEYRGSPPPDYHGPPPGVDRGWESRHPYPPPHAYSPPRGPYSYAQRSPPGHHSDYRMHPHPPRHREHFHHPDSRGPRPSRYPHYGDSPVGLSPSGYSPPMPENPLNSGSIQRSEKT